MFTIALSNTPSECGVYGTIRIGAFTERFEAQFSPWRIEDYLSQWATAKLHISDGRKQTAFITSYVGSTNFILNWWHVHRREDRFLIQNSIVLREANPDFDIHRWAEFIPAHQDRNEDCERISSWSCPIHDMMRFASE